MVAEVGSNVGNLARHLQDVQGIERLIQIESSKKMAEHKIACPNLKIHRLQADEEALPLRPQSVDLVLSCLSLHWVNDLPGTLKQIRRALKPDGAFVAAMIGGNSLQELRSSFLLADMERLGGISPHVSPMAFVRDVGSLMQNAGFSLPTVDSDTLTIPYPDMFTLMYHLKGMGENNAVLERREHISRDVFLSAAAAYSSIYGDHTLDGMIPATVQVLYMIGWNPDPSQAKPIQRGSAQKSLKDIGTEK